MLQERYFCAIIWNRIFNCLTQIKSNFRAPNYTKLPLSRCQERQTYRNPKINSKFKSELQQPHRDAVAATIQLRPKIDDQTTPQKRLRPKQPPREDCDQNSCNHINCCHFVVNPLLRLKPSCRHQPMFALPSRSCFWIYLQPHVTTCVAFVTTCVAFKRRRKRELNSSGALCQGGEAAEGSKEEIR